MRFFSWIFPWFGQFHRQQSNSMIFSASPDNWSPWIILSVTLLFKYLPTRITIIGTSDTRQTQMLWKCKFHCHHINTDEHRMTYLQYHIYVWFYCKWVLLHFKYLCTVCFKSCYLNLYPNSDGELLTTNTSWRFTFHHTNNRQTGASNCPNYVRRS